MAAAPVVVKTKLSSRKGRGLRIKVWRTYRSHNPVLHPAREPATVQCHWCPRILLKREFTVDHVVPMCLGGFHDISNLVPACLACNQGRSNEQRIQSEELVRLGLIRA